MSEASYLGIDVGTTAIKALLVDGDFRVVRQASREYPIHCPHRDWAEQEPEDWWNGLVACVREVTAAAPDHHVAALALSTQGDTLCPADADGHALAPARTWMDARAGQEIAELTQQHEPLWWYRRCGMKPAPFHALATIPWLRKHEPEAFEQAAWFALVQDFLLFRLVGKRVVDAPNASRTIFYNTVERRWDPEIMELVGVEESRVAEARESGTTVGPLLPEAAEALNLSTDVTVALGAHDQCAAATGCGALGEGSMMLSCGTAWALVTAARSPVLDSQARLQTYCHAFPEGWTVLGAQPGGAVLRWFRDEMAPELAEDEAAYERLVQEAASAAHDAPDLIFLPHVYGAVTPAWQPQARAGFLGLTLQHDRGSLVRGLLEGVALEARWNVEVMEEVVGPIEELRMIGGAAKSRTWAQTVADATGKRVLLPEVSEAAAYGAALLAAKAIGAIKAPEEATEQLPVAAVLETRPAEKERLDRLSAAYRSLFSVLAAIWTGVPANTTP